MPSAFDELFATAGFPDLLVNFGEPVTYTPLSGAPVSATAIITREPARSFEVNGKVITPRFLVRMPIRAVNTGGDKITLYDRPSDASPREHTVVALLSTDSGVIELAVN